MCKILESDSVNFVHATHILYTDGRDGVMEGKALRLPDTGIKQELAPRCGEEGKVFTTGTKDVICPGARRYLYSEPQLRRFFARCWTHADSAPAARTADGLGRLRPDQRGRRQTHVPRGFLGGEL